MLRWPPKMANLYLSVLFIHQWVYISSSNDVMSVKYVVKQADDPAMFSCHRRSPWGPILSLRAHPLPDPLPGPILSLRAHPLPEGPSSPWGPILSLRAHPLPEGPSSPWGPILSLRAHPLPEGPSSLRFYSLSRGKSTITWAKTLEHYLNVEFCHILCESLGYQVIQTPGWIL